LSSKETSHDVMKLPDGVISALENADRVLVLTGAGMSAESGVPTFRDAQSGLWAKYRPEDLATPEAFRDDPQLVWDWYAERRKNVQQVDPHAGHYALVKMEQYFEEFALVTQNVDSLHQKAGSREVIELHGNIMLSICSETGKKIEDGWIKSKPGNPPASPHHPRGLARPGVVWFGETLPEGAMSLAMEKAAACDVCFSIGTSTLVQPAASLPFLALDAGAVVIEINPVPTFLSPKAHFSLQATAAEALTAIASGLAT
jgi:NAD-dependent deacetylase